MPLDGAVTDSMLRKRSAPRILAGVALALGVWTGGRLATAAAGDRGRDAVWLRWQPSDDAGVESYVVWRCAGLASQCPTGTDLAHDVRWTRMTTFAAKDACAKTPCSGKIRDRLRAPLSYVVIAVRNGATSPASNVVTLESEPRGRAADDAAPDDDRGTVHGSLRRSTSTLAR